MEKRVRLIITKECNLDCGYCCNKIKDVIDSFKTITLREFLKRDYDVISITGGEPLLVADKLIELLEKIPNKANKRIYLYSNGFGMFSKKIGIIAKMITGVNIDCHENFLYTFKRAMYWKKYIKKVRLHIQDMEVTPKIVNALRRGKIDLVQWKMNDCDNLKEDRFILVEEKMIIKKRKYISKKERLNRYREEREALLFNMSSENMIKILELDRKISKIHNFDVL